MSNLIVARASESEGECEESGGGRGEGGVTVVGGDGWDGGSAVWGK